MPAATILDASRRFAGFYVPRFEIRASGAGVEPGVLRDVLQVTYNDSTTEIDSFDMTVNNWDPQAQAFKYVGAERDRALGDTPPQRLFNPNAAEFELRFGYGDELVPVMRGFTQSLEPSFPSGGASTLTVRALNVLHRLRTRQNRDHWPNDRVPRGQVKISRIAEDIGTRSLHGCRFPVRVATDAQAKAREPVLEYVAQNNQYDLDFLLEWARRMDYVAVLRTQGTGASAREVLYFGPSQARGGDAPEEVYDLEWGKSLIDFTPKLSTANQLTAVEVRSHDRETNRDIRERVTMDDVDVNADLRDIVRGSGPRASDRCASREQVITNEPQHDAAQARRRAADVLSDRLKQLVEATGTTVGLPDLRAGTKIRIRGLGARFSGRYFVTKTTHTLDASGYRTKFTARREAPLPEGTR